MPTSLFCDRVVLGRGDTLRVESALIQIQDATITNVQALSREAFEALPEKSEILDLGDSLLGPSFVNGHTHLAMSSLRGVGQQALRGNVVEDLYYTLESRLTPEDVRAFVRMGAYENLLCGVTACWDHYYHAEHIALGMQDVGICGVVAPTLQDLGGPGQDDWENALETTLSLHRNSRFADTGIYPALGPHATDTVSPELWRRIAELSEKYDLPLHCHVAQSIEEYQRSMERYKLTPIAYLDREGVLDLEAGLVLVHSLFVTDRDLGRLNPAQHILAYCPLSQIQFAFPAHIQRWSQAGIAIQVGTDAGACNDTMNVQQELRVLAGGNAYGVTRGRLYEQFQSSAQLPDAEAVHQQRIEIFDQMPSMQQMLTMVWDTPGQASPALNMGEIAPGKRANINCWNPRHPALWPATDPLRALVMCDASPALQNVMVNGQWIAGQDQNFQASILNSNAFAEAQREASERLHKLLARCGLL